MCSYKNLTAILDDIKKGNLCAFEAKEEARKLPDFNEAMLTDIKNMHDNVMSGLLNHQARVTQVNRRGW